MLNQIRVGQIDESSEMMIQSRFIDSEDSNYPRQALHIFAENAPVSTQNHSMLNQLAGLPIEIGAIALLYPPPHTHTHPFFIDDSGAVFQAD